MFTLKAFLVSVAITLISLIVTFTVPAIIPLVFMATYCACILDEIRINLNK